jgi:hypothetical protein
LYEIIKSLKQKKNLIHEESFDYEIKEVVNSYKLQLQKIANVKKRLKDGSLLINNINTDTFKEDLAKYPFTNAIYDFYRNSQPPLYAGMSDIMRIWALKKYGGIYLDFDANLQIDNIGMNSYAIDYNDNAPSVLRDGNCLIVTPSDNNLLDKMEEGIKEKFKNSYSASELLNLLKSNFHPHITSVDPKNLQSLLKLKTLDEVKNFLPNIYDCSYLYEHNIILVPTFFEDILTMTGPRSKTFDKIEVLDTESRITFDSGAAYRRGRVTKDDNFTNQTKPNWRENLKENSKTTDTLPDVLNK